MKNKAIFLDRDGVIIEEHGYINTLSQSALFPFSAEAIGLMNQAGFLVIGITNQSAIARGLATVNEVEQVHRDIQKQLLMSHTEARIQRFYYCPFYPDHPWRKPRPGMLLQAARDFDIDLSQSYMIGDSAIDIQAGQQAGCQTVLVLTGKGMQTKTVLNTQHLRAGRTTENILSAANLVVKGE